MLRCNSVFIGILNLITLIVSISVLGIGLWRWITNEATTECERLFEKLIIPLGVLLLVVSLIGLIGACSAIPWFLEFYLLILLLLFIALAISFLFFGHVDDLKGIEPWLQKKINNSNNWNTIKSCLQPRHFCSDFHSKFMNDTVDEVYTMHLLDLQVRIFFIEFIFMLTEQIIICIG
jgi:hypothetical protein